MLDPNLLRNKLNLLLQQLLKKNFRLDIEKISSLENQRKKLQMETETLQHKHNVLSNLFRDQKNLDQKNQTLMNKLLKLSNRINCLKMTLTSLQEQIYNFSMCIPNIPDDDIPNGKLSIDNKEVKRWGEKRKFHFIIKNHLEIGNKNKELDWKSSVKVSGSGFVIMKGNMALLHRALIQFMLDTHTLKHGYKEVYVPYLVHPKALYGTGQLPKFSDDLFHIHLTNKTDYILIPTGEVPLTNFVYNEIIDEKDLPIMLVTHTPCFRSESNSYGREVQGLIRLHQFEKVELVQIVHPETSMNILEKLTNHAEIILQMLNLPYRKMLLCAGETGFSAAKTYDLEVWFPSQNKYVEVSSCSNMTDFQARRIKARYKTKDQKKKFFVHTLNGSGLAVGRTLAAILENYQQPDGSVEVPAILQKKYMQGLKFIN
ncbi:serine--tRNA ligase [Buchnera aphidicola (Hyadaphis tataricae)]|uniref:Serine--tRNA ligase n=1 Tax=Buchnera aphidicola (Hyadaphis tataricae) TaxID=1241859 RepID=A0A4D6XUS3_9GAMM|nr:serine--tRNA ligase [Buchnera aphidicola]QCI21612.1 serine--tRNA ligase [Buchnera aphidicola (Hyadaphis tataricae)]